jgi:CBS domain-containing protein
VERRAFVFVSIFMSFTQAGQLAREVPLARLDDSLGMVAENLREAHGALPVVASLDLSEDADALHVVGIIDERDLMRAFRAESPANIPVGVHSHLENGNYGSVFHADANAQVSSHLPSTQLALAKVQSLKARDVMTPGTFLVPEGMSLLDTLTALEESGRSALPVVDAKGRLRGTISRADVVSALGGAVRPPVVGGMATPLGVWLTTGHVSGGAPPIGLFLSGALLALCILSAHYGLFFALNAWNPQFALMFLSGRFGAGMPYGNLFNMLATAVELLLFLTLMRLLPLSGTHAAEHQTVHAIERGLPLRPEFVGKMPRAHPRCGTNLVALALMCQIVISHLPSYEPHFIIGALLFIFLFWRNFGTFLQEKFTTRTASEKQLQSGIRAGEEILRKYQEQPHAMTSFGQSIWNSGITLCIAGAASVMILEYYARLIWISLVR